MVNIVASSFFFFLVFLGQGFFFNIMVLRVIFPFDVIQ